MSKELVEYNGLWFHPDTPQEVKDILVRYNQSGRNTRLRIYLGDTLTGRDWQEEHDVAGYIGKSTGSQKVPLLVHSTRSFGGGHILDHRIVKIATAKGKRVLYQHPKYHAAELNVVPIEHTSEANQKMCSENEDKHGKYTHSVLQNGEVYANCKSERYAKRLVKHLS